MSIAIIGFPEDDVKNFAIIPKNSGTNLNILRKRRDFEVKSKSFFLKKCAFLQQIFFWASKQLCYNLAKINDGDELFLWYVQALWN